MTPQMARLDLGDPAAVRSWAETFLTLMYDTKTIDAAQSIAFETIVRLSARGASPEAMLAALSGFVTAREDQAGPVRD